MSLGPEGHAPSRSDLNRTREAGAQLSCCKGEAKDKNDSLKAQSRPWIFSLCLGLELQDYVFCDDRMNSDSLNQNNPGPKNHFRNWKQLRLQRGLVGVFFFFFSFFFFSEWVILWLSKTLALLQQEGAHGWAAAITSCLGSRDALGKHLWCKYTSCSSTLPKKTSNPCERCTAPSFLLSSLLLPDPFSTNYRIKTKDVLHLSTAPPARLAHSEKNPNPGRNVLMFFWHSAQTKAARARAGGQVPRLQYSATANTHFWVSELEVSLVLCGGNSLGNSHSSVLSEAALGQKML